MIRKAFLKHRRKKGIALALAAVFGVVSLAGIPYRADADGEEGSTGKTGTETTGTEAAGSGTEDSGSGDNAKQVEVPATLLADDHGRIVFWEWRKVTPKNFRELLETKGADGSYKDLDEGDFRACMFVIHDSSGKPKGFISTYADGNHVIINNAVNKKDVNDGMDTFLPAIEPFDGKSRLKTSLFMDLLNDTAYTNTAVNKKLSSFTNETFSSVVLVQDQDGLSLNDRKNLFEQDLFYTSGTCMGVLWMRPYSVEKKLMPNSKEIKDNTYVRTISMQTALTRASAKGNTADMFYNSIGKNLNGNKDYFITGIDGYGAGQVTGLETYSDPNESGIKLWDKGTIEKVRSGYHSYAMVVGDDPADVETNERGYVTAESAGKDSLNGFTLIPADGTDDSDKWLITTLRFSMQDSYLYYSEFEDRDVLYYPEVVSQYLVEKGGYFFTIDSRYYSGRVAKNKLLYNTLLGDILDKSGDGSFNKDKTLSMEYTWYVGTPHVYATIKGEGGDPESGEGTLVTIKKGETMVLKNTSYLDSSGNEVVAEGVVLSEGSKIVIEEGGLLSVEGNFINDGTIINKGGTILIKDGGTMGIFANTNEGTVTCCQMEKGGKSGDIVIMPGGKYFAFDDQISGNEKSDEPALTMTGGATLVNYGTFALSTATMDQSSLIDNRKDGVALIGYNRENSGVLLNRSEWNAQDQVINGLKPIPEGKKGGITGISLETAMSLKGNQKKANGSIVVKGTLASDKNATLIYLHDNRNYADINQVNVKIRDY